jgi:hypothetical protein
VASPFLCVLVSYQSLQAQQVWAYTPAVLRVGKTCSLTWVAVLRGLCRFQCAPIFSAFWEDCGSFLGYTGLSSFDDFAAKCQDKTPDDAGSNAAACDAGELLTTILFSCSSVDQNNPEDFCNTECSSKLSAFVLRCGSTQTTATSQIFQQARTWLGNCPATIESCHSPTCDGDSEPHCAAAPDRATCTVVNSAATSVFCQWQACEGAGGNPPPPPPVIVGCMDTAALNYVRVAPSNYANMPSAD